MIAIRRNSAPSLAPTAAAVEPPYTIPTLAANDPGREAYLLLGSAWRSSKACLVQTGQRFDVVRAPQQICAPVLAHLRSHRVQHGAVFAESGCWDFFVPLGSGRLLWPHWVTYLGGPTVQIPPRAARDDTLNLRWITRGAPTGQLLTDPEVLRPTLTGLAPTDPRSGP
ncbi:MULTISPECIES: hypothetical protein [Streptomyces]|uniref:Uncharacterized protein n=1 Tax=Streptomyces zinciresistens K42 TaxID=700597 RepID=G2GBA5_9ACTN|nr:MULTISPECIES: hypothetical protein [Streptomyces]EGX59201.1 hypothetical protein SZN_13896 [Streptomyces zinciresistens K42]MDT9695972.1 hypothetical protein [Streptomyces sp. P17]